MEEYDRRREYNIHDATYRLPSRANRDEKHGVHHEKLPHIVLKDVTGRHLDTFTHLQEAIYRARQNIRQTREALTAEEWRLPHAPPPARPDYSRAAPPMVRLREKLRGDINHLSKSTKTTSTRIVEVDVDDVAFVAQSLNHLPNIPSLSFLRQEILCEPKNYMQIVQTILLHKKFIKETDKRDATYNFPGFCTGCRRAGLCYGCEQSLIPHYHADRLMKTGGGFTYYKKYRPEHEVAGRHPLNWKIQFPELALCSVMKGQEAEDLAQLTEEIEHDENCLLQQLLENQTNLPVINREGEQMNDDSIESEDKNEDEGIVVDRKSLEERFSKRDPRSAKMSGTSGQGSDHSGQTGEGYQGSGYQGDGYSEEGFQGDGYMYNENTDMRNSRYPHPRVIDLQQQEVDEDLLTYGESFIKESMDKASFGTRENAEQDMDEDAEGSGGNAGDGYDENQERIQDEEDENGTHDSRSRTRSTRTKSTKLSDGKSIASSSENRYRDGSYSSKNTSPQSRKYDRLYKGQAYSSPEGSGSPDSRKRLYRAPPAFKIRKGERRKIKASSPFSSDRNYNLDLGRKFELKKSDKKVTQFKEFQHKGGDWKAPQKFELKKNEREEIKFWKPTHKEKDNNKKKRTRRTVHPTSPDSGLDSEKMAVMKRQGSDTTYMSLQSRSSGYGTHSRGTRPQTRDSDSGQRKSLVSHIPHLPPIYQESASDSDIQQTDLVTSKPNADLNITSNDKVKNQKFKPRTLKGEFPKENYENTEQTAGTIFMKHQGQGEYNDLDQETYIIKSPCSSKISKKSDKSDLLSLEISSNTDSNSEKISILSNPRQQNDISQDENEISPKNNSDRKEEVNSKMRKEKLRRQRRQYNLFEKDHRKMSNADYNGSNRKDENSVDMVEKTSHDPASDQFTNWSDGLRESIGSRLTSTPRTNTTQLTALSVADIDLEFESEIEIDIGNSSVTDSKTVDSSEMSESDVDIGDGIRLYKNIPDDIIDATKANEINANDNVSDSQMSDIDSDSSVLEETSDVVVGSDIVVSEKHTYKHVHFQSPVEYIEDDEEGPINEGPDDGIDRRKNRKKKSKRTRERKRKHVSFEVGTPDEEMIEMLSVDKKETGNSSNLKDSGFMEETGSNVVTPDEERRRPLYEEDTQQKPSSNNKNSKQDAQYAKQLPMKENLQKHTKSKEVKLHNSKNEDTKKQLHQLPLINAIESSPHEENENNNHIDYDYDNNDQSDYDKNDQSDYENHDNHDTDKTDHNLIEFALTRKHDEKEDGIVSSDESENFESESESMSHVTDEEIEYHLAKEFSNSEKEEDEKGNGLTRMVHTPFSIRERQLQNTPFFENKSEESQVIQKKIADEGDQRYENDLLDEFSNKHKKRRKQRHRRSKRVVSPEPDIVDQVKTSSEMRKNSPNESLESVKTQPENKIGHVLDETADDETHFSEIQISQNNLDRNRKQVKHSHRNENGVMNKKDKKRKQTVQELENVDRKAGKNRDKLRKIEIATDDEVVDGSGSDSHLDLKTNIKAKADHHRKERRKKRHKSKINERNDEVLKSLEGSEKNDKGEVIPIETISMEEFQEENVDTEDDVGNHLEEKADIENDILGDSFEENHGDEDDTIKESSNENDYDKKGKFEDSYEENDDDVLDETLMGINKRSDHVQSEKKSKHSEINTGDSAVSKHFVHENSGEIDPDYISDRNDREIRARQKRRKKHRRHTKSKRGDKEMDESFNKKISPDYPGDEEENDLIENEIKPHFENIDKQEKPFHDHQDIRVELYESGDLKGDPYDHKDNNFEQSIKNKDRYQKMNDKNEKMKQEPKKKYINKNKEISKNNGDAERKPHENNRDTDRKPHKNNTNVLEDSYNRHTNMKEESSDRGVEDLINDTKKAKGDNFGVSPERCPVSPSVAISDKIRNNHGEFSTVEFKQESLYSAAEENNENQTLQTNGVMNSTHRVKVGERKSRKEDIRKQGEHESVRNEHDFEDTQNSEVNDTATKYLSKDINGKTNKIRKEQERDLRRGSIDTIPTQVKEKNYEEKRDNSNFKIESPFDKIQKETRKRRQVGENVELHLDKTSGIVNDTEQKVEKNYDTEMINDLYKEDDPISEEQHIRKQTITKRTKTRKRRQPRSVQKDKGESGPHFNVCTNMDDILNEEIELELSNDDSLSSDSNDEGKTNETLTLIDVDILPTGASEISEKNVDARLLLPSLDTKQTTNQVKKVSFDDLHLPKIEEKRTSFHSQPLRKPKAPGKQSKRKEISKDNANKTFLFELPNEKSLEEGQGDFRQNLTSKDDHDILTKLGQEGPKGDNSKEYSGGLISGTKQFYRKIQKGLESRPMTRQKTSMFPRKQFIHETTDHKSHGDDLKSDAVSPVLYQMTSPTDQFINKVKQANEYRPELATVDRNEVDKKGQGQQLKQPPSEKNKLHPDSVQKNFTNDAHEKLSHVVQSQSGAISPIFYESSRCPWITTDENVSDPENSGKNNLGNQTVTKSISIQLPDIGISEYYDDSSSDEFLSDNDYFDNQEPFPKQSLTSQEPDLELAFDHVIDVEKLEASDNKEKHKQRRRDKHGKHRRHNKDEIENLHADFDDLGLRLKSGHTSENFNDTDNGDDDEVAVYLNDEKDAYLDDEKDEYLDGINVVKNNGQNMKEEQLKTYGNELTRNDDLSDNKDRKRENRRKEKKDGDMETEKEDEKKDETRNEFLDKKQKRRHHKRRERDLSEEGNEVLDDTKDKKSRRDRRGRRKNLNVEVVDEEENEDLGSLDAKDGKEQRRRKRRSQYVKQYTVDEDSQRFEGEDEELKEKKREDRRRRRKRESQGANNEDVSHNEVNDDKERRRRHREGRKRRDKSHDDPGQVDDQEMLSANRKDRHRKERKRRDKSHDEPEQVDDQEMLSPNRKERHRSRRHRRSNRSKDRNKNALEENEANSLNSALMDYMYGHSDSQEALSDLEGSNSGILPLDVDLPSVTDDCELSKAVDLPCLPDNSTRDSKLSDRTWNDDVMEGVSKHLEDQDTDAAGDLTDLGRSEDYEHDIETESESELNEKKKEENMIKADDQEIERKHRNRRKVHRRKDKKNEKSKSGRDNLGKLSPKYEHDEENKIFDDLDQDSAADILSNSEDLPTEKIDIKKHDTSGRPSEEKNIGEGGDIREIIVEKKTHKKIGKNKHKKSTMMHGKPGHCVIKQTNDEENEGFDHLPSVKDTLAKLLPKNKQHLLDNVKAIFDNENVKEEIKDGTDNSLSNVDKFLSSVSEAPERPRSASGEKLNLPGFPRRLRRTSSLPNIADVDVKKSETPEVVPCQTCGELNPESNHICLPKFKNRFKPKKTKDPNKKVRHGGIGVTQPRVKKSEDSDIRSEITQTTEPAHSSNTHEKTESQTTISKDTGKGETTGVQEMDERVLTPSSQRISTPPDSPLQLATTPRLPTPKFTVGKVSSSPPVRTPSPVVEKPKRVIQKKQFKKDFERKQPTPIPRRSCTPQSPLPKEKEPETAIQTPELPEVVTPPLKLPEIVRIETPPLPEITDKKREPVVREDRRTTILPVPKLKEAPKSPTPKKKKVNMPRSTHKRRTRQPAEAPVTKEEVQKMQDPLDFLAKYCIISKEKLPFYERIYSNIVEIQPPKYDREPILSPRTGMPIDKNAGGDHHFEWDKHQLNMLHDMDTIHRTRDVAKPGQNVEEQYLEKISYTLEILDKKQRVITEDLHVLQDKKLECIAQMAKQMIPEIGRVNYQPKTSKKGKKKKKKKKGKNMDDFEEEPAFVPLRAEDITNEVIAMRLDETTYKKICKKGDIPQIDLEMQRYAEKLSDIDVRLMNLEDERNLLTLYCMEIFFKEQNDNHHPVEFRRQQSALFKHLHPDPDVEMNIEELEGALQVVNNNLISPSEFDYLYQILNLPGRRKINFQLFTIIAALSEKISQMDPVIKKLLIKDNPEETKRKRRSYEALDLKMETSKELFGLLADGDYDTNNNGNAKATSLAVELTAGGLDPEHVSYVLSKFNRYGTGYIDFMDFVTYVPLFIEIHQKIVDDPFNVSLDV